MGGGAWPFLVGGVICLVNSDNERDLSVLNRDGHHLTGEVDRVIGASRSSVHGSLMND